MEKKCKGAFRRTIIPRLISPSFTSPNSILPAMEAITLPTSSSTAHPLSRSLLHSPRRLLCSTIFSPQPLSTDRCRRSRALVITAAKKRKNKPDSHSFVPKPGEATGPFPEAVLLKQKTVREDGRVLPEFVDDDEEKLYEFLSLQLESDLNVERVRHYEVVYLIHEDHVDEVESVIAKVQAFIRERKGRIWRQNNWGLRRLAYKIQKAKNANYILMNFELEAKCIDEFKTMLDKDERVIRHLVIKRDEAITEDCPPPPEFRTLRPEGMDDDGDEDDDYDDADGDEDEIEAYEDDEDNIIVVDEDDSPSRRSRRLEVEKVTR